MVTREIPNVTEFATKSSTGVARRESSTNPLLKKFGFTKRYLDALPPPTNGQRKYYYDAGTRGLAIAVSPAGKKSFVLYRKIAGRPERTTIGPYPDVSIEQARNRAAELNAAIARGENPAESRRSLAAETTLGELFEKYLELYAKDHVKTWKADVSLFNFHLAHWRLRKISSIRKVDVTQLHTRIGLNSGKVQANRVVERLRAYFGKAQEWGWKGENPALRIQAFPEQPRKRFLRPEEFQKFFVALRAESNETVRDFLLLALFTGARRSNVSAMRWENIDFPSATWTIPITKSGESVTITLSKPAMVVLRSREQTSEWVFPGVGRTGHLVEPHSAWSRIVKRAGIENLRIHDLRRTLGSWQALQGTSLQIIGKSLGHQSLEATAIYAQLLLDPVRESVERATAAMLAAAELPLVGDGK
jgi:integrase